MHRARGLGDAGAGGQLEVVGGTCRASTLPRAIGINALIEQAG
jgi:hypothetical protein